MAAYLRLITLCFLIFFTPGYLLGRISFDKKEFSLCERIPIWFCLSLGVLTIPGILAYLFNFNFYILLVSIIFAIVLLLSLNILKGRRHQAKEKGITSINGERNLFLLSFLVILMGFAITVLSAYFGTFLERDALNFLAFVRKLSENPFISNYTAYYRDIGVDPTYGYNIWHLAIALLSSTSGIDPIQIWNFVSVLLTPIIILSFYTFAKALFSHKETALICSLLFLLYYGINQGLWLFRVSAYNVVVNNFLLFPIALTLAFKYLRENKVFYLFLSCLLGFTIATIHLFGLIIIFLALVSFYFFHLLFKRQDKQIRLKILHIFLLILLLSSFYIMIRLPTLKVINPYYLKPTFMEKLSQNLYYINPKRLCAPHYHVQSPFIPRMMYIPAFLLTPFLLIYAKRRDEMIFLFSNMATPPLIMLNPVLVPIFAGLIGFGPANIMSQLLPFLLVIGFFLSKFLFNIKNPPLKRVIIVFILFFILINPSFNSKFVHLFRDGSPHLPEYFKGTSRYIPILQYIHDNILETSVFLTNGDYKFSLFLTAYTKHYVMLTHPGHASPAAADQEERERSVKNILDPMVNLKDTIELLRKYNVNYIVIDKSQIPPKSLAKFKKYPKIFNLIFDQDGLFLYRIEENV